MHSRRFVRHSGFVPSEIQRDLAEMKIVVVGLGGLGSHVVQQLTYLGAKAFVLVDHDRVDESNLNRLIGATPADVAAASLKIDVAERVIRSVESEPTIEKCPEGLLSRAAFSCIQQAGVIFGCVDKERVRLALTQLSQVHAKLYIDIATEIPAEAPGEFGGRVVIADGDGCISCRGALDQHELRRENESSAQREEEDRIYGVSRNLLQGSGPAVVSLNGILASIGVMEFVVGLSGLRPRRPYLVYRGSQGLVFANTDRAQKCAYCSPAVRGTGNTSELEAMYITR